MAEERFTIYETHNARMFMGHNVCVPVTIRQSADNVIEIVFGHGNPKMLSVQFFSEQNGDITITYKKEENPETSLKLANAFGR